MKKLYLTNEARENAIKEIKRQIDILMKTTSAEIGYVDGRRIIDNLILLRDAIKSEMD